MAPSGGWGRRETPGGHFGEHCQTVRGDHVGGGVRGVNVWRETGIELFGIYCRWRPELRLHDFRGLDHFFLNDGCRVLTGRRVGGGVVTWRYRRKESEKRGRVEWRIELLPFLFHRFLDDDGGGGAHDAPRLAVRVSLLFDRTEGTGTGAITVLPPVAMEMDPVVVGVISDGGFQTVAGRLLVREGVVR